MGAKVRPPAPAGYSGTPLPKKLGIKADHVVALVDAPSDFARTVGALPPGAVLRATAHGAADLAIWFARSAADVADRMPAMADRIGPARCPGLWVAWPKKASGVPTDLTENEIRRIGLAHGLVDYKVCAIDHVWSGLKFARRKQTP